MVCSSRVGSLNSSAIEIFDALDDYGGMVDGIDMCPKELLRELSCQTLVMLTNILILSPPERILPWTGRKHRVSHPFLLHVLYWGDGSGKAKE